MTDNPAAESGVKALCVYPGMNNLCKALSLASAQPIRHPATLWTGRHFSTPGSRTAGIHLVAIVWTVKNLEPLCADSEIDRDVRAGMAGQGKIASGLIVKRENSFKLKLINVFILFELNSFLKHKSFSFSNERSDKYGSKLLLVLRFRNTLFLYRVSFGLLLKSKPGASLMMYVIIQMWLLHFYNCSLSNGDCQHDNNESISPEHGPRVAVLVSVVIVKEQLYIHFVYSRGHNNVFYILIMKSQAGICIRARRARVDAPYCHWWSKCHGTSLIM